MYVLFSTGTLPAGQCLQNRLVVRQNVIFNAIPIFAVRNIRSPRSTKLTGGAVRADGLPFQIVVLAGDAVRAGGLPFLIVVLAGGAVRAGAIATDPVRPSGAAHGVGDRATLGILEHIGLSGSTEDPRGTTEGSLIIRYCKIKHCTSIYKGKKHTKKDTTKGRE